MSCCSSPVAVDVVWPEAECEFLPEQIHACFDLVVSGAYAISMSPEPGMGELEEEIASRGREFQRQVLEAACQRKADNCPPLCPICREPLSRVRQGQERIVQSRFGAIRLVRAYGYCRECKQFID